MNNKQVEKEYNIMTEGLAKEFGDKFKDGFKLKAIGYLDITEPQYEVGEVPNGFVEKLKALYHKGILLASLGFHDCEFCLNQGVKKLPRDARSSSQKSLRDKVNKIDYMFPEMIFHYIIVHMFKPPQDFIDFVMSQ